MLLARVLFHAQEGHMSTPDVHHQEFRDICWMVRMVPYVVIMLLLAWVLLMFMCPFKTKSIELKIEGTSNASKRDKIIVSVIISNSAAANLIVPILAVVGTALLDDPTASQSFITVGGLKTLVVGVVGFALGYGMLILIGF